MNNYRQIVVIGYGVITERLLSYINDYSEEYGYLLLYVEHEIWPLNTARKYAQTKGLDYHVIEDKLCLASFFEGLANNGETLIISASNNFIFTNNLVNNPHIKIVNFHNALLPDLPGRNAPSWAIYYKYKKTGITWHYVTTEIDAGDIIIQKECSIGDDMRAYELVSVQMKLAEEAFKEIFINILDGTVNVTKQDIDNNRMIIRSQDVPGEGSFNLDDDTEYIYRLLRAMDYGKNRVFPIPKSFYHGKQIIIKRYKIISIDEKQTGEDKLYLPVDDERVLMLKYESVSH